MKYKLLLTSLTLVLFILITPKLVTAKVLFEDNFDDNDISDWTVIRNMQWDNKTATCLYYTSIANWTTNDGKVGIKIYGPGCITELIPTNFKLGNVSSYTFEVDMEYRGSAFEDRNILFKYLNADNWYDLHFYGTTLYVHKRIDNVIYEEPFTFEFGENGWYHIRIEFSNKLIITYINNIKVSEVIDNEPYFTGGTIGLQASVGASPLSEVFFDNVVVSSQGNNTIDTPTPTPTDIINPTPSEIPAFTPTPTASVDIPVLKVPYFNQNSSPWGTEEYDHANDLGFPETDFERWGCAVTSIAMIMRYNNLNSLPDGKKIDPGSLNEWLKNQVNDTGQGKGYLTGTDGNNEAYSYLNWPIIGSLSKEIYNAGKSHYALTYNRADLFKDISKLDDLLQYKIPGIIHVTSKVGLQNQIGHFIVAKGKIKNIYSTNDPEWNSPTLADFNNSYDQLDYYVPSHTNLSYIVLVVNKDVELLVTDPHSKKTGKTANSSTIYNEIENASYTKLNPIINPDTSDSGQSLGTGVNEFLLPTPENGTYRVELTSNANKKYTLNVATFKKDGKNYLKKLEGNTGANNPIIIEYNQDTDSTPVHGITIQSTIQDIIDGVVRSQIPASIARGLIMQLTGTQKDVDEGRIKTALSKLQVFKIGIDLAKFNSIDSNLYDILSVDVEYLLNASNL